MTGHIHADLASRSVDDMGPLNKSPVNTLLSTISLLLLDPRSNSSTRRAQLDRVFALIGLPR